jgi:hypothetical protein
MYIENFFIQPKNPSRYGSFMWVVRVELYLYLENHARDVTSPRYVFCVFSFTLLISLKIHFMWVVYALRL